MGNPGHLTNVSVASTSIMFKVQQIVFIVVLLEGSLGGTVKRDLPPIPIEFQLLQLGNLGPLSTLAFHPGLAHLSLSPRQSIGFVSVLLGNGLLAPGVLWSPVGRVPSPEPRQIPQLNGFRFPTPEIDPYFWYVLLNHSKYLPYGLGPQGIYGSTGLPKSPAVLKNEKH